MTIISNRALLLSSNAFFYSAILTSPFWFTGVLLATLMMNDSGRYKGRFQIGCLISLLASPISLIYTISYHKVYNKFNSKISLLPFIPVISYIGCAYLMSKDKREDKK